MAQHYKVEMGKAIQRRRQELGLTQKDLADLTHYKEPQTVSRWERGETTPADLDAVARALQWTLAEMTEGIKPPDRRTARRLGLVNNDDATPDPFASYNGNGNDAIERLERIEQQLKQLANHTTEHHQSLEQAAEALLDFRSKMGNGGITTDDLLTAFNWLQEQARESSQQQTPRSEDAKDHRQAND